eukprot:s434_g5.t1
MAANPYVDYAFLLQQRMQKGDVPPGAEKLLRSSENFVGLNPYVDYIFFLQVMEKGDVPSENFVGLNPYVDYIFLLQKFMEKGDVPPGAEKLLRSSEKFVGLNPYVDYISLLQKFMEKGVVPLGAGRGGITCPNDLVEKSRFEYNYLLKDWRTHGNCCPQAFVESAIQQNVRPAWKRMNETKRAHDARRSACDWAAKNKEKTFWGGLTLQEVAQTISHTSFDKWVNRHRLTDAWADVVFLHALACSVGADVLLIDNSSSAKLLGLSLMSGDQDCTALVPVAMDSHFHFWPLVPLEACPAEQVSLSLSPWDKPSVDWDPDYDPLQPAELAIGGREQELQLCEALTHWSPFDLPTENLIECLQSLS